MVPGAVSALAPVPLDLDIGEYFDAPLAEGSRAHHRGDLRVAAGEDGPERLEHRGTCEPRSESKEANSQPIAPPPHDGDGRRKLVEIQKLRRR